jgi:hypothetical protein
LGVGLHFRSVFTAPEVLGENRMGAVNKRTQLVW